MKHLPRLTLLIGLGTFKDLLYDNDLNADRFAEILNEGNCAFCDENGEIEKFSVSPSWIEFYDKQHMHEDHQKPYLESILAEAIVMPPEARLVHLVGTAMDEFFWRSKAATGELDGIDYKVCVLREETLEPHPEDGIYSATWGTYNEMGTSTIDFMRNSTTFDGAGEYCESIIFAQAEHCKENEK
jgi:hypothetical protein